MKQKSNFFLKNIKSLVFIALIVLIVAFSLIPAAKSKAYTSYAGCGIESMSVSPSSVTSSGTTQITTTTQIAQDCVPNNPSVTYGASWSGGNFTKVSDNGTNDTTTSVWNLNSTANGTYTFTVTANAYRPVPCGYPNQPCVRDSSSTSMSINVVTAPTGTITSTPTCTAPCSPSITWNSSNVVNGVQIFKNGAWWQNQVGNTSGSGTDNGPSYTGLSAGSYQYCLYAVDSSWHDVNPALACSATTVNPASAPAPSISALWNANNSTSYSINTNSSECTANSDGSKTCTINYTISNPVPNSSLKVTYCTPSYPSGFSIIDQLCPPGPFP